MLGQQQVTIRVLFGSTILNSRGEHVERQILVSDQDSVLEVKRKISAAFSGKIPPDQILLAFGPVERKLGKTYINDPAVDEGILRLSDFSCLAWLQRFPHWRLTVRFLPPTPPPPGVATTSAAALSEGKDPVKAVAEARAKGEIPTLLDLPAPWGKRAYTITEADSDYQPAKYPPGSQPIADKVVMA